MKIGFGLLGAALLISACGGDIGGDGDGDGGDGASGLTGTGAGTGTGTNTGTGGSPSGTATGTGGSPTGTMTGAGGSPTGTMTGTGGSPTGTGSGTSTGSGGAPPTGCTADGLALIDAINAYRMQNSLPAVPASNSLCIVADTHVTDLAVNAPHAEPGGCNLHSWSDQGNWSACCYTPDHAQAACMWAKPSELTSYNSNGYEISYAGSNNPQSAVNAWSNSSGHNNVILNLDIWANYPWGAIGAAQHDGFAHVWFGTASDP